MPFVWTTEQVLSLASSKHFQKNSRQIADVDKWLSFGFDGRSHVWGEFPNKQNPPIQVKIALSELTFDCSCASRRFPCMHALGLLLLCVEQPPPSSPLPDWMTTWIDKHVNRIKAKRQREVQEAARPFLHNPQRQANVLAGLQELDLWLQDLIRNGLAAVRHKPASYWTQMANRLVDAQAGGAAHELKQMSAIPKQDGDWPEALLSRIGRLHLLTEGFNHFDDLPLETQADLRTAVGWLPNHLPPSQTGLRDQWHILGQQMEQSGKRHIQRIWLWGQHSDKPAQIVQVIHGLRNMDNSLVNGTVLEARLRYYPSAAPLRAQIIERFQTTQPQKPVTGYATILAAATAYSEALAVNPWLKRFPMALTAVIPEYNGATWFLRDEDGHILALPADTKQGWHLRALSGGRPMTLFGIWDGRSLTPLTVWSENRWLPLHMLRGVK